MSIYEQGLGRAAVNHVALSPLSFIERTAAVYPHYPAVVHGSIRRNWAETYARCRRLASALAGRGIGKGDTVAVMLPNIPAMLEAHFGVPMIGAVLNTLNVRLDAEAIAFMLQHGEAKVVIADREFFDVIHAAIGMLDHPPLVIDVDDPEYGEGQAVSDLDYEAFLAEGDPEFAWQWPTDEWQAISLNYTSGTTGNPKGVVYHHRGAFLNAMGNQMTWAMGNHPVYLWTLPMFHCNGWCYPWTITALAGVHVFLRRVDPAKILTLIRDEQVTHLCGAPIVLNALVNMPAEAKAAIDHPVKAMVAGAAPPAKVIGAVEEMGIRVTHVYGLTEVYGPGIGISCKYGTGMHIWDDFVYLEIVDPETGETVPDGEWGEICLTTLVKEGAPLIRFRTHDLSRIIPGDCPCGSKFPRIDTITGRSDDMFKIHGVNVFPRQIEEVLATFPQLSSEYQIRLSHLEGKDTMRIYVETDGTQDFSDVSEAVAEETKSRIGFTPLVKVVELGVLPRSEKKTKRVFDERYE